jgi:hypothetical protein
MSALADIFIVLLVAVPGVAFTVALWPRDRALRNDIVAIASFGWLFGAGIISTLFFAVSLSTGRAAPVAATIELLVSVLLIAIAWRRRASATPAAADRSLLAPLAFVILAGVSAIAVHAAWSAEPHGSWDGWAIWNMHARFMFRAGPGWPELLRDPLVSWTHGDYPWLYSASVARTWCFLGRESTLASGLISSLFAFSTAGILFSVLSSARNVRVALASTAILLGTPFFVQFAPQQHADIPVGCAMLAAVSLLLLGQEWKSTPLLCTAGTAAGLAAWTKNEGLLFVAVFVAVAGFMCAMRKQWRECGALALGLGCGLAAVAYFKLQLAPTTDLVANLAGKPASQNLVDASRHALILHSGWRDLARFGEWHLSPYLALALALVGPGRARFRGVEHSTWIAVLLMLAGYYAVYLLTPFDLAWHLDSSLVRLLLQLWPMALLAWGLAVPKTPASPGRDLQPSQSAFKSG